MCARFRILLVGASGVLGRAVFCGLDPMPLARAARRFCESIEALETGKTYGI